jgi:uncharacterized protein YjlB
VTPEGDDIPQSQGSILKGGKVWDGPGMLRAQKLFLPPNGLYPNNPPLPVLVYRACFPSLDHDELEMTLRGLFESNGWSGCWRGDVYDFAHYHSNTHEVIGVCSGNSFIELGGPEGPIVGVSSGDILVLPAGTAHRKASVSEGFSVVGAYPGGIQWDLCRGTREELAHTLRDISLVPAPRRDPVLGADQGAVLLWKDAGRKDPSGDKGTTGKTDELQLQYSNH